jgi:hypothetical protein
VGFDKLKLSFDICSSVGIDLSFGSQIFLFIVLFESISLGYSLFTISFKSSSIVFSSLNDNVCVKFFCAIAWLSFSSFMIEISLSCIDSILSEFSSLLISLLFSLVCVIVSCGQLFFSNISSHCFTS